MRVSEFRLMVNRGWERLNVEDNPEAARAMVELLVTFAREEDLMAALTAELGDSVKGELAEAWSDD